MDQMFDNLLFISDPVYLAYDAINSKYIIFQNHDKIIGTYKYVCTLIRLNYLTNK